MRATNGVRGSTVRYNELAIRDDLCHLLSYYLANKRSLHVRSQDLKIHTLIGEKYKTLIGEKYKN